LRAESPVAADSAAGLVSEIATVRTSAETRNMGRAYLRLVCAGARDRQAADFDGGVFQS
jgi:hypothetical protein